MPKGAQQVCNSSSRSLFSSVDTDAAPQSLPAHGVDRYLWCILLLIFYTIKFGD